MKLRRSAYGSAPARSLALTLQRACRFLSLRGLFIGYASRARGNFVTPRWGTMPPPARWAGSLRYAFNEPLCALQVRCGLDRLTAIRRCRAIQSFLGLVCSALPVVSILCGGGFAPNGAWPTLAAVARGPPPRAPLGRGPRPFPPHPAPLRYAPAATRPGYGESGSGLRPLAFLSAPLASRTNRAARGATSFSTASCTIHCA